MLPILGYLDEMGQKRTGVSEQQQGSIRTRCGQTARLRSHDDRQCGQQRIRLIARIFAEILPRRCSVASSLLTDGDMEPIAYRLRGQFVQYDPNDGATSTT